MMDGGGGGGGGTAGDEGAEDDQQVDNSRTVLAKIAQLYAERLMSDVVLVVGEAEFPSHRLILCASSDVFQVMLMSPSWSESRETRVVLRETPSAEAVFEDFLRYLYTGKILIDYATVIPLVSLADKYNVRDLLRIGLDFMARNVSSACRKNQVVSWLSFATAAGHEGAASLCREFIAANFGAVSASIDFPNMEHDALAALLARNDLVVEDERAVFAALDAWLSARRELMLKSGEENVDVHMDRHVQELLPLVRFPMMTPKQLAELMLSPLSQSHTELLVDRIRAAMRYHSHFQSLAPTTAVGDRRFYTPRLYTCDRFCSSLSVDHFRGLQFYQSRGLVFTSQSHTAEAMLGPEEKLPPPSSSNGAGGGCEWAVDVFPKGVWFRKCLTVYQPLGLEVPERVLKTVRVSILAKEEAEEGEEERGPGRADRELRVKIGVLVMGDQDGMEHVRKVVTRNYIFGRDDRLVNFDDVVDFEELVDTRVPSKFLCGPLKDTFKILVVVAPLTKLSSLDYQ